MTPSTFDPPGYAKKLENAGFTCQQAEAQATALMEILEEKTATKHDLKELEPPLKYDPTIRLGGIAVACTAILLAGLPFILK